jgi:hypothetical protein
MTLQIQQATQVQNKTYLKTLNPETEEYQKQKKTLP